MAHLARGERQADAAVQLAGAVDGPPGDAPGIGALQLAIGRGTVQLDVAMPQPTASATAVIERAGLAIGSERAGLYFDAAGCLLYG